MSLSSIAIRNNFVNVTIRRRPSQFRQRRHSSQSVTILRERTKPLLKLFVYQTTLT
jgi:hypothetical protein